MGQRSLPRWLYYSSAILLHAQIFPPSENMVVLEPLYYLLVYGISRRRDKFFGLDFLRYWRLGPILFEEI
jgi:hypothetical protein